MNSEFPDIPDATSTSIDDLTQLGREKLEASRSGAENALGTVTGYIRENPWAAVGAAVVVGGLVAVLARREPTPPSPSDAVRSWLDDAYAKLPSQKQVQSLAESSGVPDFLKELGKKLHLR